MSKTSIAAFSLVASSLVLFGWGCNPFQAAQDKIAEKVAEGMVENATGADVDLSTNSVTVTDDKTGTTASFGEDVKLPDDFPSDMPMYPGAKLTGVTLSRTDGISGWVTMTTADEIKKVVDWFAEEMKGKGWTTESSMTVNGSEYRSWKKDETTTLTVNLTKDADTGETSLIATYIGE
ncbi:MAG: hypothetical protein V1745_02285 [Patescibacteria group bacterium]